MYWSICFGWLQIQNVGGGEILGGDVFFCGPRYLVPTILFSGLNNNVYRDVWVYIIIIYMLNGRGGRKIVYYPILFRDLRSIYDLISLGVYQVYTVLFRGVPSIYDVV